MDPNDGEGARISTSYGVGNVDLMDKFIADVALNPTVDFVAGTIAVRVGNGGTLE